MAICSGVQLRHAAALINQGGILAYPTEAVYGLGCNPFNSAAVTRLLTIKGRPTAKGFILIAAEYSQVERFVGAMPNTTREKCLATWPGPITWIVPASAEVPEWLLTGNSHTIALRITAHPLAAELCRRIGHPLISTSANRSGARPLRSALAVRRVFGKNIDGIISGALGGRTRPTPIYDALTGDILRAG